MTLHVLTPLAARFTADQAAEELVHDAFRIRELEALWEQAAFAFLRAFFGAHGSAEIRSRGKALMAARARLDACLCARTKVAEERLERSGHIPAT